MAEPASDDVDLDFGLKQVNSTAMSERVRADPSIDVGLTSHDQRRQASNPFAPWGKDGQDGIEHCPSHTCATPPRQHRRRVNATST
jgi:hypothetical protein